VEKIMKKKSEFINREISWLSFNERVLQEAEDKSLPLLERMRFLGIFSNNLDEFYKVRVATLRRATGFSKKPIDPMDFDPVKTLLEINEVVNKQQARFTAIFNQLLGELSKAGIQFINEKQIRQEHILFIQNYFREKVKPFLVPVILSVKNPFPPLNDNSIYFAIELKKPKSAEPTYSLLEIPSHLPRFITLPGKSGKVNVIFIDDLIRYYLPELFSIISFDQFNAYAVKTTRDAELDLDDDVSKSFVEKMARSISQRKKGQYVRMNYDQAMPATMLDYLLKRMKIRNMENISAGGRYHNKKDLMSLPDFGRPDLCFATIKPLQHPRLKNGTSFFEEIRKKDILLHFPYHSFSLIIDLLREAAIDPDVRTIRISLYRVAKNSQIINALITAARNGKRVLAVIELQARFDEENNIAITRALTEAGVRVIPGVHGLKVHCKLIQISKKEQGRTVRYVHIGTGNFHERTANIYSDTSLLTANKDIGAEVRRIFEFFESNFVRSVHRLLVVSPFNTRRKFVDLINAEIELAEKKKPAFITIKMNNLVDPGMIRKLYEASNAGVKIKLIIRGICSLIPGIPGKSENIEAISVIGRYLEHSRIIVFGNGGQPLYFISSADWMGRNIDHRIEVSTPILDDDLKKELQACIDLQLEPNAKVRIIDQSLRNGYKKAQPGKRLFDSQMAVYDLLSPKKKTVVKRLVK
jgi:polyphosphate kinase